MRLNCWRGTIWHSDDVSWKTTGTDLVVFLFCGESYRARLPGSRDAFFLWGGREKHQKSRFLRILMLFSCGAGVKSIRNWDFSGFWCFFHTELGWKASEIEIFADYDTFFLRSWREKHQKLRFLWIMMLFFCGAGAKSIRNWEFSGFWCFLLCKRQIIGSITNVKLLL